MDISISQDLLDSFFKASIITVVFLLAYLFISWIFPKTITKIETLTQLHLPSLRIRNFEIISASSLISKIVVVLKFLKVIIYLLGGYLYLSVVLSQFPHTEHIADNMLAYIVNPLREIIDTIIGYIPNAIYLVMIFFVMRWTLRIIKSFFERIESGSLRFEGFHREWAAPTYQLTRIFVFVFTVIIAFPHLPGASTPAFQGVSVFIGLLISLGSSSAISNLTSGLVITYMRPFKVGDRVRLGTTFGDIVEKNLLVTRIRTIHNVDITVPNSMILNNHIQNYSSLASAEGLQVSSRFRLSHSIDWKVAHQYFLEATAMTADVWKEKQPIIYQSVVDQNFIEYELNVFTQHPLKSHIIASDLNSHVLSVFAKHGIDTANPSLIALSAGEEFVK